MSRGGCRLAISAAAAAAYRVPESPVGLVEGLKQGEVGQSILLMYRENFHTPKKSRTEQQDEKESGEQQRTRKRKRKVCLQNLMSNTLSIYFKRRTAPSKR